ncbi:MAG: flavodoxin-dependent (E)-4-hydroxy-3-methylbut-2-enyl-diphosphate synthase [Acholeplasmatales bacterium]|nr:flavodoxin-dependent (E)-4-hydroxy-3-methylbut-2-enyl-diphosphate synthase [Acholeplasmatales bacterium]
MYLRTETRPVKVGNLTLGGNSHVYIQSMCNTPTKDIDATVKQILELEKAGCEIIRVACLDMTDCKAIGSIVKQIHIPLVADIHFNPDYAIEAIKQGVNAIRLNPGNIRDVNKIKEIVQLAKEHNIPIRIGVNGGSLPKGTELNAKSMVDAAMNHVKILEDLDFHDIVISLKASNIKLSKEVYELAASTFPYPLHVGITEAGTSFSGLIKSAMGMDQILSLGIGNTIRISLTDEPIMEIRAAKEILNNLNLIKNVPYFTSCPTCGRTQYNMIPIAKEIENYLYTVNKDIHVAVMGCAVNGPGEAREADLGVAGGIGEALLFKKGQIVRKIKEEDIISELKKEIDQF